MTIVRKRRTNPYPRIVHDPKVCGGDATVAGTRVPVTSIVVSWEYYQDMGELLRAYPRLDVDAVEQALAYYRDHPDEIREAIEEDNRIASATWLR